MDTATSKSNLESRLLAPGEEEDQREGGDVESQVENLTTAANQQPAGPPAENNNEEELDSLTVRNRRFFAVVCVVAGIPLPGSKWWCGLYPLQLVGLGAQVYFLWAHLQYNIEGFDAKNGWQGQANLGVLLVLDILQPLVPMAFLFYLTRSKQQRRDLERMVDRAALRWWMVVLPLVSPLGLAISNAAFPPPSVDWFFIAFFTDFPAYVCILVCFAYVLDRGAPHVESIDDLIAQVEAFEEANKEKMALFNKGLIYPMVAVKAVDALDVFWDLFYYYAAMENESDEDGADDGADDRADDGADDGGDDFTDNRWDSTTVDIEYYGLLLFFCITFMFSYLLPLVHHTVIMNAFRFKTITKYAKEGNPAEPCPGAVQWLSLQSLGWKAFFTTISPQPCGRVLLALATAIVAFLTRVG